MGIEIYPQTLKSGLWNMNKQLECIIESAKHYTVCIVEYIDTEKLQSIAFESQKNYMKNGHIITVESQIQAMQSICEANQKHIGLIDSYLGGESYISEDTLKFELVRIRNIQQMASKLKVWGICSLMDELYNKTREKLNRLYNFVDEQGELYSSAMANIHVAELNGRNLHHVNYNKQTGVYLMPLKFGDVLTDEEIFSQNMLTQYGFDEKTSKIMLDVYEAIEKNNPKEEQKEIDRMFARSISQLCYNKGDKLDNQWRVGAGFQYGYNIDDESNYFVDELGLSKKDYQYLRQMVRLQHLMVSTPDEFSYDAAKSKKELEYDKFKIWKENMEKAVGETFSDDEYLDYYKQIYSNMKDKTDCAHMMYTISANLASEDTEGVDNNFPNFPADILSGNFWASSKVRKEYTGWLGDATYEGKDGISFGNDDYMSDLDASNISKRINDGSTIIDSMNEYYAKVSEEPNVRCEEFLKDTDYIYVEEKVLEAAKVDSLENLKNKKGWMDSYKFLWNLSQGNGIMKNPES